LFSFVIFSTFSLFIVIQFHSISHILSLNHPPLSLSLSLTVSLSLW
jgi:hypothetical protein